MDISLVQEDGTWKLDELTGFEGFDQGAYADALLAVNDAQGLDQDIAQCISDNLRNADSGELEAAVVSGDADQLNTYYEGCS
jgi:hypothetical protein